MRFIRSPVLRADLLVLDSLWDPAGEKKRKQIMTRLVYRKNTKQRIFPFPYNVKNKEKQTDLYLMLYLFHISGDFVA